MIGATAPARTGVASLELGVVQQLLVTRKEAAEALGMSLGHFQRHVEDQLPCVSSGQLKLYRPLDLERWIAAQLRAGPVRPQASVLTFIEATNGSSPTASRGSHSTSRAGLTNARPSSTSTRP